MTEADKLKVVATNRRARHDYFVEDTYEAGIVLMGTEIKSIRAGRVQLRDAYVGERDGELWLLNAHIAAYDHARENHDPLRPRKLLLHKREIRKIGVKMRRPGYTMIALRVYLKRGRAKVEIALARGKRQYDKRQQIAKRETERDIARRIGRRG
ncbi:MAG: SsrA-binding protein SmpB [Anaerolineales bacterium]